MTKKTFISNNAVFDERIIPGLSKLATPPITLEPEYVNIPISNSRSNQVGADQEPNQVGDNRNNALDHDSSSDSNSSAEDIPAPSPPPHIPGEFRDLQLNLYVAIHLEIEGLLKSSGNLIQLRTTESPLL